MKLLLVTPARNEEQNLADLLDTISNQDVHANFEWVVVVNASTDNTLGVAQSLRSNFPIHVVEFATDGVLASGAAFRAWDFGVKFAVNSQIDFDWVFKLDADITLDQSFFSSIFRAALQNVGVVGGVLVDPLNREQLHHVQGAAKGYSRMAYQYLHSLPRALGFDVMDEILLEDCGLQTQVCRSARYTVNRLTGSSEGLLRGRVRNGVMCRWTGYSSPYFVLHCLRYLIRRPFVFGSVAICWGFVKAGSGPYDKRLKGLHRRAQRRKLYALLRNPIEWLRNTYGLE